MRSSEQNANLSIADVVIVGGGVIGLGIARSLARRGIRDVTVVERATSAPRPLPLPVACSLRRPKPTAPTAFSSSPAQPDMYPSFALALFEESGIDIELDRTGHTVCRFL